MDTNSSTQISAPNLAILPQQIEPQNNQVEPEQQKMFDFGTARIQLERLINDWKEEIDDTMMRRQTRKVDIEVEKLRQEGKIDEDETFIPQRIIQQNIEREQPMFVNYIKNSRRLGIFECQDDPEQQTDLLEEDFTKKLTYLGWELDFFKSTDGSQAHGWDAIEVIYDEAKPGHVAFEQVGHDKLIFPRSATNLQACPRILRQYDVTFLQLRSWVTKYGFDAEQVECVLQQLKDTQKENETLQVYKCYFKGTLNGITQVFVSWFSVNSACKNWLKAPSAFRCGILDLETGIDRPVEMYPIFIHQYKLTEESPIAESKGRAWLDEYKQEANTAMWSAFVNGMNRAAQYFACVENDDGSGGAVRELENTRLTNGRIMNKPIKFFNQPYPDALFLKALQYSQTSNSEENNQVNFTVMNRDDARKTATELNMSQQQQGVINSVPLTLYSVFVRQILSFAWLIIQSQAVHNKIKFLLIKQQIPMMDPIIGMPRIDPQTGQPMMQTVWVNDITTIKKSYNVRAAGDVDVVQAQEIAAKMQQDWALVSQTVLKDAFMIDYIKIRYPQYAERYAAVLSQSTQMAQLQSLTKRLALMLDGVLKDAPETVQQLPPEQQSALVQTLQEAQQITGQENLQASQ